MKKPKPNQDVRDALKNAGVNLYELCEVTGECESTIYRNLRHEMTPEMKEKYLSIIKQ